MVKYHSVNPEPWPAIHGCWHKVNVTHPSSHKLIHPPPPAAGQALKSVLDFIFFVTLLWKLQKCKAHLHYLEQNIPHQHLIPWLNINKWSRYLLFLITSSVCKAHLHLLHGFYRTTTRLTNPTPIILLCWSCHLASQSLTVAWLFKFWFGETFGIRWH